MGSLEAAVASFVLVLIRPGTCRQTSRRRGPAAAATACEPPAGGNGAARPRRLASAAAPGAPPLLAPILEPADVALKCLVPCQCFGAGLWCHVPRYKTFPDLNSSKHAAVTRLRQASEQASFTFTFTFTVGCLPATRWRCGSQDHATRCAIHFPGGPPRAGIIPPEGLPRSVIPSQLVSMASVARYSQVRVVRSSPPSRPPVCPSNVPSPGTRNPLLPALSLRGTVSYCSLWGDCAQSAPLPALAVLRSVCIQYCTGVLGCLCGCAARPHLH